MHQMSSQNKKMQSCCSHCDMGKTKSSLRLQKGIQKKTDASPSLIAKFETLELKPALIPEFKAKGRSSDRPLIAASPPIFILESQFLI